jgi:hypothetical protein
MPANGAFSNADNTLCVDLFMSFDVSGQLGSSNLVFSYDPNGLSSPTLEAQGGIDPMLFFPALITEHSAGKGSINLELRDVNQGMEIPGGNDSTYLVTVCFEVTDPSGDHNLDWYVESTRGTVLYLADERTRMFAGQLKPFVAPAIAPTPDPDPDPTPGGGATGLIGFVSKFSTPTDGDQTVINELLDLGHTVEVLASRSTTAADAAGMDVIYISSSVNSNDIGTRYRDLAIPVIVCEAPLLDDMKMTGGNGHFGNQNDLVAIELEDPTHPIAAGLPGGTLTMYSTPGGGTWGSPSADAASIASWPGNDSRKVVFAYETGQSMVGLTAPARRVGLFLHDDGLANSTAEARTLLANAICWAMGGCGAPALAVGNPYGGTAWPVPGVIQAEDFDEGGQGEAYDDRNTINSGGEYRNEGVDIELTEGGGYDVGWIKTNEWMQYTINVEAAGDYQFAFRVAARSSQGRIRIDVDSQEVASGIIFPPTGGWQTWSTVYAGPIALEAGPQVMRISIDAGGFNFDQMEVTPLSGSGPLQTETITLSPIHDAYMQGTNGYNQGILRAEHNIRTSYLRFDLSQIQGNILDASLKLTCVSDPGNGPMTVHLGDQSEWTEDNLTTNNRPVMLDNLATRTGSYNRDQEYVWELGAMANLDVLNLVVDHESGDDVAFAAKEYSTPGLRPQLVLTVERSVPTGAPEVEWLEVEASEEVNEVQINWWVSREVEIDLYQLERSIDGVSYQQVGVVSSQGNTNSPRMYNIVDSNPLPQHKFYRIRAFGANGYSDQSEVIRLDQMTEVLAFNVFPTPLEADQLLNIELEVQQTGPVAIGVFNYQGALVMGETTSITQTTQVLGLDINALQPGLYIVSVMGQGWAKSERFQVQ